MLTNPEFKHRTFAPASKSKVHVKHKLGGDRQNISAHNNKTKNKVTQLKFVSRTCSSGEQTSGGAGTMTMDSNNIFPKLDLSIPEQKHKLEQRRKMISYGKNTVGYTEYIRQIPKERRKKRSMETPMTPDHTLDIPNKRWLGQIRAWRLALHKYDPPDLQASLASVVTSNSGMDNDNSTTTKSLPLVQSIQDRELENAKKNGLLVDLGERSTGLEGRKESFLPTTTSKSSPTSVVETFMMGATSNPSVDDMRELDLWESAATPHGEADNLDWDNYGDDDSDDDLL